jgi:hypothetical protein
MAGNPSEKESLDLPRYLKRAELDKEGLEIRDSLEGFVTKLARAVLQNSYYSPDHPMARKTADEPYELLRQLGKRWHEFTFVVTSWTEERSVALEGVFAETVPIDELIGGTAGEHFSSKLWGFFQRNR